MKKILKNFLIAFVVAVVSFAASLIIQYNFTAVTSIKIMVAIAIWCGLLAVIMLEIIRMPLEQKKEFSLSILAIKVFMTFTVISMIFLLSTIGNQVLNTISTTCFFIGFQLLMVSIGYASIKELIKIYKKCKKK